MFFLLNKLIVCLVIDWIDLNEGWFGILIKEFLILYFLCLKKFIFCWFKMIRLYLLLLLCLELILFIKFFKIFVL